MTDERYDERALVLHSTTDAQVWAEHFLEVMNEQHYEGVDLPMDKGTMIAWFANAIETGRAHGQRQLAESTLGILHEGAPEPQPIEDTKYVTFKRSDLFVMLGMVALPPWRGNGDELLGGDVDCAVVTERIKSAVDEYRLHDSVVIRRQDYFAAPALNAYASCLAIAARMLPEADSQRVSLLSISDYFHQQAEAAGEEAWKLPD